MTCLKVATTSLIHQPDTHSRPRYSTTKPFYAVGNLNPAPSAGNSDAAPPRDLPQRFHVAEVAASFGVRPRTVRSWIEKGLLEREKVGNAVFIRADQIEAMLSRGRRKKDS